ncbi:MAG: bifunctional folylpolyglutamate synthase/dihydrofolate synthase [Clostridia bacterium]|nr:bifunctional folylpolyglutamate synthase/dihydrofolate synthase [Clostridia bacterium]
MTYDEAVEKINSLLVFGSKPGLERVSELVRRTGSPDKKLRFVHVAGTNGKGSVCASIASILTEAGYKTGLFISPFVIEFRERFQINGEMIPYRTLADIVEEIFPVVEKMKEEGKIITEFEMVLAVALKWYETEQCDVVVLETGLGGRFDATNIIDTPLASVIMSISLDHTAILGDTCEKIAFEKCGIIKPGGVTVLYGDQPEGVFEVVKKAADERNNRLVVADPNFASKTDSGLWGSRFVFDDGRGRALTLTTPLIGDHQLKNAAAALCTIGVLRERGLEISDEAAEKGLAKVSFPARLELLSEDPVVLLDGAHNPGGAGALSAAIKEHLAGSKKIAVVGMLADKDVHTALSMLIPLFDHVVAVQPDNPRAMTAEALAEIVREYGVSCEVCHDYGRAYELAAKRRSELSSGEDRAAIVVFGSLYLASDMRRVILGASEDTNA